MAKLNDVLPEWYFTTPPCAGKTLLKDMTEEDIFNPDDWEKWYKLDKTPLRELTAGEVAFIGVTAGKQLIRSGHVPIRLLAFAVKPDHIVERK